MDIFQTKQIIDDIYIEKQFKTMSKYLKLFSIHTEYEKL